MDRGELILDQHSSFETLATYVPQKRTEQQWCGWTLLGLCGTVTWAAVGLTDSSLDASVFTFGSPVFKQQQLPEV